MAMKKNSDYSSNSKHKHQESAWIRRGRYWYKRLLRLRGKPEAIARGWAVGVFVGCFPLLGLQMIFGVFLATVFKGNRLAAIAGTWISNPFTSVPIFIFNFKVGKLLLGWHDLSVEEIDFQSFSEITHLGYALFGALFFGCFVVGLVSAFVSYCLSLWLITRFRRLHRKNKVL
jgi:uncharacterized protein